MENKETKNNKAEELNDEALDEVTGGVTQPQYKIGDSISKHTTPQTTVPKTPGVVVTDPTLPGLDTRRKY